MYIKTCNIGSPTIKIHLSRHQTFFYVSLRLNLFFTFVTTLEIYED